MAQKRKVKEDKKDAEEVRKRAMERLGDRTKRSENEGKGKKKQHPAVSKGEEWKVG